MKNFLPLGIALLFLSVLLTSTQRSAQAGTPQGDLEARVAELEEALAGEKKEAQATRATLEELRTYLEKQALSAKTLSTALDQVETLGFAKGINFESRAVLLRAWHVALSAAQKGLPKAPAKKIKGETARVRASRSNRR